MPSLRSHAAACCLLLLALSIAWGAPALETMNVLFQNWNTRDGLPGNRVNRVMQTSDGYIWIALEGGLARFDGAGFQNYGPRDGLLATSVLDILEEKPGTLWLATLGGGVSVLKNGVVTRSYGKLDGLPSNWIDRLTFDVDGRIVAHTPNGYAVFENDRFHATPNDPYKCLPQFRDAEGSIWGLNGPYLKKWDKGDWKPDVLGGPKEIDACCLDHQGQPWAYRAQKLWQRRPDGWQPHDVPAEFPSHPKAVSLAFASDGTLWITFHKQGLYGFRNGQFFRPAPSASFQPNNAENLFVTADGQNWLTSAQGLFRFSPSKVIASQIDEPSAMSVANEMGGLLETAPHEFLIASQGNGFYRWQDGHASRLNEHPDLGSGVYGNIIYRSSDGTLWLGSSKGLHEIPPGKPDLIRPAAGALPPGSEVWALKESRDGALWIGTSYGHLSRMKNGTAEAVTYGGQSEAIRVIEEGADGALWIGTRGNGLFRRKAGEWKRFGRESGLLSETIRTLYTDPAGRLWVGTDGGGLSLCAGERFHTITTHNGLPGDSVSQLILDDEQRLWVGTDRGLAIFSHESTQHIATGNIQVFYPVLITRSDGLPSEEFNIVPPVRTRDGMFAFGTSKGFVRLRPQDFRPDHSRTPVLLERFLADGSPIPLTSGKISLPAGSKRVELKFTGLFFSAPERLKFRSRLVGLEPNWIETGIKRSIEYRNLLPGHYRFEVEATTGNGLWSTQPASIEIYIAPHFWQTLWFQGIIAVLMIGIVAWLIRFQERKRTRQQIEVLERRQAVDAERARIARDLHDDVGASLTQVALQSQIAERNLSRRPERAEESLKEIFKTAKDMTRALDEIVWAVNPSHDTLDNFISFLGVFVQDYAKGAGLRSRFDIPASVPALAMSPTLRHHLYLATKEILHNIVKHAGASLVTLKVTFAADSCSILIRDNGRGFAESPAAAGADGLSNLKNRLELVHGECIRRSSPDQGVEVELRVPLNG